MAMAGIPMSWQPRNRSAIRAAPSSMEYSECTCRWTNESPLPCVLPGIAAPTPNLVIAAGPRLRAVLSGKPACPTLVRPAFHAILRRACDIRSEVRLADAPESDARHQCHL